MSKDFRDDNPEHWKWGVFYVNAKDDRVIVPKRIKSMGWTLNFAHPKAYMGFALIIIIIIASQIYFRES